MKKLYTYRKKVKRTILDKLFKNGKGEFINIFDVILGSENGKDYIYAMAEARAINIIAKTIAKTELQVYSLNKDKKVVETRDELYWKLNIQPNFNENGTMFLYKLVTKLLIDKKALILINEISKGEKILYVADEFDTSKDILYSKKFSNVKVSDNEGNIFPLTKIYTQNNSIYYSIQNSRLDKVRDSYKTNSGKLLSVITKKYIKSNTSKWKLKKPGNQLALKDAETGKDLTYEEFKNKLTEGLLSEEEAVIMLSEMFDLVNLNKDNNQSLGDYKDIVKQIGDTVANRYDIPLDIFYGNKTEKSTGTNDFITFGVDPYFELLEDGFNIGLVGKQDYLKGERVMFNRFAIQHKDILESANGIDKLHANTFSRNEINKFLRLPDIDEDWANRHNLTKNYANVEGGAENDGE